MLEEYVQSLVTQKISITDIEIEIGYINSKPIASVKICYDFDYNENVLGGVILLPYTVYEKLI